MDNTNHGRFIPQTIQEKIIKSSSIVLVVLSTLFIVVPLYLMIAVSIQPPGSVLSENGIKLFITQISLENFQNVFQNTNIEVFFRNSIIVTVCCTILSTTLSVMAGYGLTRFEIKGKVYFARLILYFYMFSPIILAIPLYVLFNSLGLLNTYIAIILGVTAISCPFTIWLMWQYFQTVPISFEESAWIRGASRWRTIWDVLLPIAKPGIVATIIFSFSVSWNDFTIARVILTEENLYTAPVGINLFLADFTISWGELMATTLLISIPPFIVALTLKNYLLQGFDIGGLD